ncbi:MAG: recombinase family protein, partial [Helicobacter sp.]|nr:recombinase family protein [Helicobacter sp.]
LALVVVLRSDNLVALRHDRMLIYAGRVVYGKMRQKKIEGTDEYRRVRSDNVIISDTIAHEPIVSEELFPQAKVKREASQATGRPNYGCKQKHLLEGLLRCPECGGAMCAKLSRWTRPNGTKGENLYYQCEHNKNAKGGHSCQ